jgi:Secretion system C-terminal sorting domain
MKTIHLFFIFILSVLPIALKAQLEKVIVETYYVSNASDSVDVLGDSNGLPVGSKTYRVYVDLQAGSKLLKLYGSKGHALKFSSTNNFFNKIDRGRTFGYLFPRADLRRNTVALDTWLTLAQTSVTTTISSIKKTSLGVVKPKDNDGVNLLIPHNPVTMLTNNDTIAGLPLTQVDGNVDVIGVQPSITNSGIVDNLSGNDSTVFGSVKSGNSFITSDAFLKSDSGVVGADTSNMILVAQLTTIGDLSFELNMDIKLSDGTIKRYVASETKPVSGDTIVSAVLKYPAACGCKDINYLEYSNTFSCSLPSACKTPLVLGCMDVNACNYNPNANFPLNTLCCYVGYCNDRDVTVVCPAVTNGKILKPDFILFPNKVSNVINIEFDATENSATSYEIFNMYGIKLADKNIAVVDGLNQLQIDVSALDKGMYLFKLNRDGNYSSKIFIKE